MLRIKVVSIAKSESDSFQKICDEYIKNSSRFAQIEDVCVFNNSIAKAQRESPTSAKLEYQKGFEKHLGRCNISLDPMGKELDSFGFSELLRDRAEVNFFIGGAYGFSEEFIKKSDFVLSLSKLTFGHKLAKVLLFEQIYRGLSLLNNHPYHK